MSAESLGSNGEMLPSCPNCKGQNLWRHGTNSAGKRQWLCRTCKRVFVQHPYLSDDIRLITDRMLLEGIPVPQISVVLRGFVSRRWIYNRRENLNS